MMSPQHKEEIEITIKTTYDQYLNELSDYEIEHHLCAETGDHFDSLYHCRNLTIANCESKRETDLMLCKLIAVHTEDCAQISRIISSSSLRNKKWNYNHDHRNEIISEAIKCCS